MSQKKERAICVLSFANCLKVSDSDAQSILKCTSRYVYLWQLSHQIGCERGRVWKIMIGTSDISQVGSTPLGMALEIFRLWF